jgi:hypothetical protein
MMRILIVVGVALLLTNRALGQVEANCEEIRQAVANYGYESARQHALIHYGTEAVESGEKKCLNIEPPAKAVAKKPPAKHQQAKKSKHPAPPAAPPRKHPAPPAQPPRK